MTATATVSETPQHLGALQLAQKALRDRTKVLDSVNSNETSLEQALDDPSIGNVKIEHLLQALPGSRFKSAKRGSHASRRKAIVILARTRMSPKRPVGSIRGMVNRKILLSVAQDVSGENAWIYTETPAPTLLERKRATPTDQSEQQTAALARSLEVRRRRKMIKELLRGGTMSLEEALRDPAAETWPIGKIVVNLRRFDKDGNVKSRTWETQILRTLSRIGIPETAKAGQLTEYDRRILLLAFEDEGFLAVNREAVAA